MESGQRIVWETWHRQRRGPIAKKHQLVEAATQLGRNPKHVIDEMVRRRFLVPLFRGVYYVRDPEEVSLGITKRDPLHLFALGAKDAPLGNWYFALESAQRIHGESQEHRTVETVVSNAVQRADPIEIAGRRFEILRWPHVPMHDGIGDVDGLPVSMPSRTIVDHLYRDYWLQRRGQPMTGRWRTVTWHADRSLAKRYLAHYPAAFREWAKRQLEV